MTNASLKDQLKAVAGQLSSTHGNDKKSSPQKPPQKTHKPHHAKPSGSQHSQHKQQRPAKVKPAWLDYVQYGVDLLKAYYPNTFFSLDNIKPLKKGIKEDLVKHLSTLTQIATDDKACMVKSLSYYVNTMAYLKKAVEGAERIDLNGTKIDIITAEEAKYSAERLQIKQAARKNNNKVQETATATKEVAELA